MVANDFRYHRNCFFRYRRIPTSSSESRTYLTDNGINWLLKYINDQQTEDPGSTILMSVLHLKYHDWLLENGQLHTTYKCSIIKQQLESHYKSHGQKVIIVPQQEKSSIIYSSTKTISYLMGKIRQLEDGHHFDYDQGDDSDNVECSTSLSNNRILYHAVEIIQKELKEESKKIRIMRRGKQILIFRQSQA